MGKIDTTKWGKFLVGDLFEKPKNTGNILARNVIDGTGSTPYVTASGINNGVMAHIDASRYNIIKGDCILVGGKTFTMTYQEEDFVSNDSHNFTLRLLGEHSKYEYTFIISVLKATLSNSYSWGDAVTADKIVLDTILLPITEAQKPNWEYMKNYMQKVEATVSDTLTKLQSAKDYLTGNIDVSKFKRFSLYDKDLFEIDSGTKLDKVKMSNILPSVNFVGRANSNNGVTDFIDIIEGLKPYEAGLLTVSLGGEYLGSCFVQDKPFYTSQNVNVLIPRHEISYYCKKYIATMIFKEGRLHYKAFIDELNRHMKTDFTIPLPVDTNNNIDWSFMENYMKKMETKALQTINLLC